MEIEKKEVEKKGFVLNGMDTEARHIFRWHVFVPDDVEFKELLNPAAWVHVAYKLQPMNRISVTSESNKFIGELVVFSAGQLWADVREVFYREFKDEKEDHLANSDYEIKWVSNSVKFAIVRKSDGQHMQKNIPDQASANLALANHISGVRKTG